MSLVAIVNVAEKTMKSFFSPSSFPTLSLLCSLVLVLMYGASGFHNNPHPHSLLTNRALVEKSSPLLKKYPISSNPLTSSTVLFNLLFGGIEEDPLETDRRQNNRRLIERTTSPYTRNVNDTKSGFGGGNEKRYVRPVSKKYKDSSNNSSSSTRKSQTMQQQHKKRRLVRANISQLSSSTLGSESKQVTSSSNSNERKAKTSEIGPGIGLQLKDPKERVLVRHATASSSYSVDDFKGKKKKIIKPWSAGRKKNKRKQNNTGGIARDGYGEDLEVEVKNAPKQKRLVVAGSSRSDNSKDLSSAAVNLLGGKKVVESESDEDKRYVSTAKDVSDSTRITKRQEKSIDEKRTVRYEQPQQSLVPTSESSSTNNNGENKNDNDRKATTSSTAGINLQLNDPKERVLVRHATASSSYSVDDFKGKKKKIIKPWSTGRRKNKGRQNNTGGIARDGYGEDLEVQVKNAPKDRRLVMARTSSSGGTQDAAKALISGGVKAKAADSPLASANVNKEEKHKMDDDDDNEPDFIRHVTPGKTIDGTSDERERGPALMRHTPTKVRDEPNLVRHVPTEPTHFEGDGEPSLVRHVVAVPAATESSSEEELNGYVNEDISEEDQIEEGEEKGQQSLVREIFASSSKGQPKLVRANIVEAKAEDPKLVRAIIVNRKVAEPKLVRANVVREIVEEPKVVRANVQQEKPPEKNLLKHKKEKEPKLVRANVVREIVDKAKLVRANVQKEDSSKQNLRRPKIEKDITSVINLVKPDRMGQKEDASIRRRLVSPPSSTTSMNDIPVADLMYGAKPATVSPTVVPIKGKSKKLVKPTFTTDSASTSSGSAKVIETKTAKTFDTPNVLMYGSRTSTIAPSSVPVDSIPKKLVRMPVTTQITDALSYGPKHATVSPTTVRFEVKPKQKTASPPTSTMIAAGNIYGSGGNISTTDTSPTSVPVEIKLKKLVKSESVAYTMMDDLMYGSNRATISPTAVTYEPKLKKFVNPTTETSAKASTTEKLTSSENTLTIFPDGDVRKVPETQRLTRALPSMRNVAQLDGLEKLDDKYVISKVASKEIRYVKPSDSIMKSATNWDAANPKPLDSNPTSVNPDMPPKKKSSDVSYHSMKRVDVHQNEKNLKEDGVKDMKTKKVYVQPTSSVMDNAPNWNAVEPAITISNPAVINVDTPVSKKEATSNDDEKEGNKTDMRDENKSDSRSKKKYVQSTASVMDNVPDWDAVEPAITISNPAVINVDIPVPKKEAMGNDDEKEGNKNDVRDENKSDSRSKKKYVQSTASVMDNVPDWDAVEPAITTSNPAVINVDIPVLKKEAMSNDDEKEGNKTDVEDKNKSISRSKKKYVQSTASVMDNVPDWDAVEPAITASNPAFVNVREKKEKNTDVREANMKDKKTKKNYVQLSTSVMNNAPDWDLCQPAITTSNPAVVNVDTPISRKEAKSNVGKKKGKYAVVVEDNVKNIKTKKKYIQPTASVMNNVPDWDLCQSAISTSNPAVFNVDGSKYEEEKHLIRAPSSSRTNSATDDANRPSNIVPRSTNGREESIYLKEEVSMFAMTPAAAETKRQQIKPKRKVAFNRPAPADTPFEYKQLQSIPKDTNPAGAKPILDEETKTKLPAAIAHAAGSSKSLSGGWIPTAHFPTKGDNVISDEHSSSNQDSDTIFFDSSEGKTQSGTMKSPDDPDALPRPTGVIPLTASSSAKEKSQLFRAEHALAPVNDEDEYVDEKLNRIEATSEKGDDSCSNTPGSQYFRKIGSSTNSMLGPDQQPLPNPSATIKITTAAPADPEKLKLEQHSKPNHSIGDIDATQKKSLSPESSKTNSKKKKIFLYDGGYPQPKEPWDFGMKGLDMKLDENQQQASSKIKKKLVAYDGSKVTGGATCDNVEESVHVSSDVLPLDKNIVSSQKTGKENPTKTK